MEQYAGIDYGMGKSNIDPMNGIRYGVIDQNQVLQAWADSSEPDYGVPTCPKCGNEATELETKSEQLENGVAVWTEIPEEMKTWESSETPADYACEICEYVFGAEEVFPDEPYGFYLKDSEYEAQCGEDGDIFITKSPYFTYAQFCSPCAPGAGYLMNPFKMPDEYRNTFRTLQEISPGTDGDMFKQLAEVAGFPKVYCFGHDFFEKGKAPYVVFKVDTGKIVLPERKEIELEEK